MPKTTAPKGDPVLIRKIGKQIDWYKTHALERRMKLLASHDIDLLLDVGANTGQYGRQMRRRGYRGKIVSFEPVSSAFARLQRTARRDGHWQALQLALGNKRGLAELHISGDTRSSSLLDMLPIHPKIADYFSYVGSERVEVQRLDSIWDQIVPTGSHPFLKIDAQGFEREILDGARRCLRHLQGIQIEMSLVALYKNEALMPEVMTRLTKAGFTLMSLEYGFCDPKSGQMLQVDGLFFR